MIDNFKGYINALLCLGIFVTILQLIIPKNKLRKYIYSLIGIIMIITVISPVVNLMKNETLESGINEVLANIDSYGVESNVNRNYEYKEANDNTVKNQVILGMQNDITNKLKEKNINVSNVDVYLEDDYDIKKIILNIKNLNNDNGLFLDLNSVVKYITEEYGIEYSKVEVIEEGK